MSYDEGNVLQLDDSFTFRCYICNKLIDPSGATSRDHVIPQVLFNNEKTNCPTINVHVPCNSTNKSKDDNWFAKTILYRSLLNPKAQAKFNKFIESAERSRTDHIDKTGSDVSNERLLKTILSDELTTGIMDENREKNYVGMLARGLIIRNSWFMKCDTKDVLSIHRPLLTLRQSKKLNEYIKNTFMDKLNCCIYQLWDDDLLYVINPKENLVYLEFYGQQTYLVDFDYELPAIVSAKNHISESQIQDAQSDIDKYNGLWQR